MQLCQKLTADDQFKSALEKHTLRVRTAYVAEKIAISQKGTEGGARIPREAILTVRKAV